MSGATEQEKPDARIRKVLLLLWLAEQVWLLLRYDGIRIVYDSHRYIAGASSWEAFNPFYSYAAIISPFVQLDLLPGISLLQVALNLVAFLAYLHILQHYQLQGWALGIAGLFFLWPELQLWNYYIHCESLYISFAMLGLHAVVTQKPLRAGFWMLLLTLLRPNGFLFPLAWLLCVLLHQWPLRKVLIWGTLALVACVWLSLDVVIPRLPNFPFWYHLTSGYIITGVDTWSVDNSTLSFCTTCSSNFLKTLSLIGSNPVFYLQFWIGRLIIWLSQVRPYYPAYHNIVVVILFLPVYALTVWGLWKSTARKVMLWLLPVLLQAGVVLIAGVDWDNRYLVIVMPCLFVLAAQGIQHSHQAVIQRFKK